MPTYAQTLSFLVLYLKAAYDLPISGWWIVALVAICMLQELTIWAEQKRQLRELDETIKQQLKGVLNVEEDHKAVTFGQNKDQESKACEKAWRWADIP